MKKLVSILFIVAMGVMLGILSGLNPLYTTGGIIAVAIVARKAGVPAGAFFMAFTDVLWTQGSENMGSIKGFIMYCPIEDIDDTALPVLSAVGKLDITVDIACKVGKQFYRVYHTSETGKHDAALVGERDGKSSENMIEFNHPGSKEAVAEFVRKIANTPCVVIYTDGAYKRVMGLHNADIATTTLSLEIPAYIEQANYTSGTKYADKKGTTFQIKQGGHPALFYKGDIDVLLAPAA